MKQRHFFVTFTVCTALAAMLSFGLAPTALAQTESKLIAASKPARLIIQVSDAEPAKWNLALNNAKNVQEELGAKNVDIEIVAYGPGLGMLKKEAITSGRVEEASMSGIKVVACENTMRNQKLTRADMHASAGYANSGVVHIMSRQNQGWSYVRP